MNKNIPNILSFSRIVSALFFAFIFSISFYIKQENTALKIICLVLLFILYFFIEFSDVADGYIARKYSLVSDFGKILDPFTDIFSRLTYFICAVSYDLLPMSLLLFIFYREITVTFLRMILLNKNVYFQARFSGKLKAVFFSLTGLCILLKYIDVLLNISHFYSALTGVLLIISAFFATVFSLISLYDYFKIFLIIYKEKKI